MPLTTYESCDIGKKKGSAEAAPFLLITCKSYFVQMTKSKGSPRMTIRRVRVL